MLIWRRNVKFLFQITFLITFSLPIEAKRERLLNAHIDFKELSQGHNVTRPDGHKVKIFSRLFLFMDTFTYI